MGKFIKGTTDFGKDMSLVNFYLKTEHSRENGLYLLLISLSSPPIDPSSPSHAHLSEWHCHPQTSVIAISSSLPSHPIPLPPKYCRFNLQNAPPPLLGPVCTGPHGMVSPLGTRPSVAPHMQLYTQLVGRPYGRVAFTWEHGKCYVYYKYSQVDFSEGPCSNKSILLQFSNEMEKCWGVDAFHSL